LTDDDNGDILRLESALNWQRGGPCRERAARADVDELREH